MPSRLIRFFLGDRPLFLRYLSVGALSALIEFLIFNATFLGLGWPLLQANISALCIALVINFAGHKGWTFRASGAMARQMRFYGLMQAISALLNNLLIYLFIDRWGWDPSLAKALQIGLVFTWNFSFCKLVIFTATGFPSGKRP